MASGLVALGGRFGGAIAPLLTALMLVVLDLPGFSSLLRAEDIPDAATFLAALDHPPNRSPPKRAADCSSCGSAEWFPPVQPPRNSPGDSIKRSPIPV
jgi:hypothetical protein